MSECRYIFDPTGFVPPKNKWRAVSTPSCGYTNQFWSAHQYRTIRPDGSEGDYYIIPRPDCIKIMALTTDSKIVMIGRWMFPTMEWSVELPGGPPRGEEEYAATARRELLAETGFTVAHEARVERFGSGHILNGLFPSRWQAYVTRDAIHVEDAGERALAHGTQAIMLYTPRQLLDLIDQGKWLTCALDAAVIQMAIRKLKLA